MYAGIYKGNEVCKLLTLIGGQVTWSMLEMPEEKQNEYLKKWYNQILFEIYIQVYIGYFISKW